MIKILPLLLAIGVAGCLGDDEEDSYSNHVMLTCNGSVLIDMTFTSKAACESHKAQNTYMCVGTPLTITC